jgi:predicted phosphodiesterase
MRYGIISDIHSNLEALEVTLKALKKEADKIICLGDLVGYGPNPGECIDLISSLNIPTIAGNHDRAATGRLSMDRFNPWARKALGANRRKLGPSQLKFLEDLPDKLEEEGFTCVHGSLVNPIEQYLTSIYEAGPTFELMTKPLLFVGHTHVPAFLCEEKEEAALSRTLKENDSVTAEVSKKTILNPGAVGQARDGDPRASFLVYETSALCGKIFKLSYPFEITQGKMRELRFSPYLVERLSWGR